MFNVFLSMATLKNNTTPNPMAKNLPILIAAVVVVALGVLAYFMTQQPSPQPTTATSPPAQPPTTTQAPVAREVKIGCLFDLTGPVAEVGVPWAYGVRAAIEAINRGELTELQKLGVKLVCIERDYAYRIPEAQAAYAYFKSQGVVAVSGLGTGDTLALAPEINKDKVPYFSASYTLTLAKNPYNFFTMASYHEAAAAAVIFVRQYFEGRGLKPRLALTYPNVPYGLEPLPAIREEARRQGVEICAEEIVEQTAVSADEQLSRIRDKCGDDVAIWVGGTAAPGAVTIKSAYKLQLDKAIIITNIWGSNEMTPRLIGDEITKWIGGRLFRVTSSLMIDEVKKLAEQGDKEAKLMADAMAKIGTPVPDPFIRGWHNVYILAKGIEYAVKNGKEPTGENIKWALENMPEVRTSYAAPVKFLPGDHRPTTVNWVYVMNPDGTWSKVTEIALPRGNLKDDFARYGAKWE